METMETQAEKAGRGKGAWIALVVICGLLAGGYAGLCAYAAQLDAFYPGTTINEVAVGGLTADQAQARLEQELPRKVVTLVSGEAEARTAEARVTLAELGYTAQQWQGTAQPLLRRQQETHPALGGWQFMQAAVSSLFGSGSAAWAGVEPEEAVFDRTVENLALQLFREPIHSGYAAGDAEIYITKARDGRSISTQALGSAMTGAVQGAQVPYEAAVVFTVLPAEEMTVEEIYQEVSGEMRNAGYDVETQSITPEQMGADFSVSAAQRLVDAAQPGETVAVSAQIRRPAVTAAELENVLFRDVLGTHTTHVGGTAARISNVKLSSASVNGTVLNSGDVFDYNLVVGQRTAARGYLPAPAYVRGETVDEIGGGVCQPSSTLYLACLKANLEIVERYAHRYVPAYIPKGMDATVSWGGPNYQFRNDTDYPVKVEAVYDRNYLTMTLYGTKTDDTEVRMTNAVLSTTPFEVVYEDDPTLPAGTETVKVTPYTGYKVETYRNLYDGNGNLISSTFEDTSDYKARNRVILRGPAVAVPEDPIPVDPPATETPGTDPPAGETPQTPPAETPDGGEQAPTGGDPAQIDGGGIINPLPAD